MFRLAYDFYVMVTVKVHVPKQKAIPIHSTQWSNPQCLSISVTYEMNYD